MNLHIKKNMCINKMKKLSNFLIIFLFYSSFQKQITDFKESSETLNNPGVGYTTTCPFYCKPGNCPIKSVKGNLILFFIDIGGFSSGVNGNTDDSGNYTEGIDYDLDDNFFKSLDANFENAKKNGGTIAVRFRYDSNGKANPEPKSFDKILTHINQIKESGVLEKYKDILMFIESGFVGVYGEQHSGKYVTVDYKSKLLEAVINMAPEKIPVTVRTPDTIAKWLGIERNELNKYFSKKGTKESRVGLYNDGYMGSLDDLGTFSNREIETSFMKNQMLYTYYGGEFSGDVEFAKNFDTYKPVNALPEMYKTHLSYINGNIFELYKEYRYTQQFKVEGVDNTGYYGQTVFKFIRDHLGYRFVLRESNITTLTSQGGIIEIQLKIENTGFANPLKEMNTEIILEKDGDYMKTEIDADPTEWYSCNTTSLYIKLKIPGEIEIGTWNIYLKLSIGKYTLENYYMRSVKFANKDLWHGSLGANFLGSFDVLSYTEKSVLTDYNFYQINTNKEISKSDGTLYTINKMIFVDGDNSNFEWDESFLVIESDKKKLYITNDNNFLYVMSDMNYVATSPVINIKFKVKNINKEIWFYRKQDGEIYYNGGSYENWLYNFNDNICEFKIPLKDLNLYAGAILEFVSIFIQDSSNDWKNVADIKSDEYIIKDHFYIFTAFREVSLKQNEKFIIRVDTSLDEAEYQWYLNNNEIMGADKQEYEISKASEKDVGIYSVKIWNKTGIEKIVDICYVIDVIE